MKNKALFQQIEIFHRLALFGDRGAFLQALAQDAAPQLTKNIKEQIDSIIKDLYAVSQQGESKNIQNQLMDIINSYSDVDLQKLKQLLISASNVVPKNDSVKSNKITKLLEELNDLEKFKTDVEFGEQNKFDTDMEFGPNSEAQSIPTRVQEQVNDLIADLVAEGKLGPVPEVKLTGIVDSATTRALNTLKTYYKRPANEPLAKTIEFIQTLSNIRYSAK